MWKGRIYAVGMQKTIEKNYTEPSIWQHLQLLKTGKGLRKLALSTDDVKLRWHALDKLLERENWPELWEVVFRSKERPWVREEVRERLFSRRVEEKDAKEVGDKLKERVCFSTHKGNRGRKPEIDAEAAGLLSDWLAWNRMWAPLGSISLFACSAANKAAEARLKRLTKEEAAHVRASNPDKAHELVHENDAIKDPEVRKRLGEKKES